MPREPGRLLLKCLVAADVLFLLAVALDVLVLRVLGSGVWILLYLLLMVLHVAFLLRARDREPVWVVAGDPDPDGPRPRTVIPRGGK